MIKEVNYNEKQFKIDMPSKKEMLIKLEKLFLNDSFDYMNNNDYLSDNGDLDEKNWDVEIFSSVLGRDECVSYRQILNEYETAKKFFENMYDSDEMLIKEISNMRMKKNGFFTKTSVHNLFVVKTFGYENEYGAGESFNYHCITLRATSEDSCTLGFETRILDCWKV